MNMQCKIHIQAHTHSHTNTHGCWLIITLSSNVPVSASWLWCSFSSSFTRSTEESSICNNANLYHALQSTSPVTHSGPQELVPQHPAPLPLKQEEGVVWGAGFQLGWEWGLGTGGPAQVFLSPEALQAWLPQTQLALGHRAEGTLTQDTTHRWQHQQDRTTATQTHWRRRWARVTDAILVGATLIMAWRQAKMF